MGEALEQLVARIDAAVEPLARHHADRLQCRKGCSDCCVDGLTVFEIEAESIRRNYADLLSTGQPHRAGACAFLDEAGACRIYRHRPYVCRTQGLPLRWLERAADGQIVELRDICPLNDKGEPVESLAPKDCWTLGPIEGELARLQVARDGGELRRVALRELW